MANYQKLVNDRDIRLSKKLSYLLRHGAVKEGVCMKPDGFVNVQELLSKKLPGYTYEDIVRIVTNNDKQRFALTTKNGVAEIKANQGHTISDVSNLNLKLIENPDFEIVHGTYFAVWPKIKNEGLSREKRNHIHFAKGFNFVCGLRKSAEIFIFIDFEKATKRGLQFLESENGVILCTGNSLGFIEPKLFLKVTTRKGEILLPESV